MISLGPVEPAQSAFGVIIHIAPKGYSYLPNTLHRAVVWSKLLPALSVRVAEIRWLSSGRRWTAGDGPPVNF
jgi:hypothetical protein